jgi:hypothetical protein
LKEGIGCQLHHSRHVTRWEQRLGSSGAGQGVVGGGVRARQG